MPNLFCNYQVAWGSFSVLYLKPVPADQISAHGKWESEYCLWVMVAVIKLSEHAPNTDIIKYLSGA